MEPWPCETCIFYDAVLDSCTVNKEPEYEMDYNLGFEVLSCEGYVEGDF